METCKMMCANIIKSYVEGKVDRKMVENFDDICWCWCDNCKRQQCSQYQLLAHELVTDEGFIIEV